MKKWAGNIILFGVIVAGMASGVAAPVDIAVDLRCVVNRKGEWGLLRVCNGREEAVGLRDEAILVRADASLAPSDQEWVDLIRIIGGIPRTFMLLPGASVERSQSITLLDSLRNRYIRWQWDGKLVDDEGVTSLRTELPLVLGFVPAEGGDIKSPYVEPGSGVSNLLAFVFHENRRGGFPLENVPPNELSFLLLNGTTEPLDAAPPLSDGSILHLSAPGIGFSTNVTLDSSGFEAKSIPAGECGQWRIPFERILVQIPAETVEAIRAADGVLDVVWKTDGLESPPLPLILLPPTQDELDAAFLANHADVPRIDENTDLTLDFRLAGIEQNKPVFLGWMRNNEKHKVLIDRLSDNSVLDSSLDAFYFSRSGHGRGLFILDVDDPLLFLADIAALEQPIPGNGMFGQMICYGWRSSKRWSSAIWVLLAGQNNQIDKINTYTEKYLPISEYARPPLPTIAPLLAYVYNPETPPELTCVLWNRTETEVQVTGSRIIATNTALSYRRELALPAGLEFPLAVAPGSHTDWRVPWSAIIEQIPPADLARIKAADGKLDLVWQANDLASPPLPLLIGWQKDAE